MIRLKGQDAPSVTPRPRPETAIERVRSRVGLQKHESLVSRLLRKPTPPS